MKRLDPDGRKRRGLAVAMAMVALFGFLGCETLPWGSSREPGTEPPPIDDEELYQPPPPPEQGLALSTEQRFSDIPLPVDVREDVDRTYVFESQTLQLARMVYTSRASVTELAQFYLRECPAADWELESVTQAGIVDIVFRKPGKRLAITVRDLGVSRSRELIVNLTPDHSE